MGRLRNLYLQVSIGVFCSNVLVPCIYLVLYLYLHLPQDNEISTFKRGTFHSQANPELSVLDLSFNRIPSVEYDTFRC